MRNYWKCWKVGGSNVPGKASHHVSEWESRVKRPGKYKILGYTNRSQKNQQVTATATSTAALPRKAY